MHDLSVKIFMYFKNNENVLCITVALVTEYKMTKW